MSEITPARGLLDCVGMTFGPGDWVEMTQDMINGFAETTGDRQWVHVDVERAAREMPDGKTIAHGYLVLSLVGVLMPPVYSVSCRQILNYGVEGLRFLNAVKVGARLRLTVNVASVEEVRPDTFKAVQDILVEIEGEARPAIKASLIYMYFD